MTTNSKLLTIDGSSGEGGGQILRSALALSIVTGRPIQIRKIRHGRAKPGLMRQHLTAVQAATAICNGEVKGDAVGSRELTFTPGEIAPGSYRFAIGTAGSATLVLQTVLPALMMAREPSSLVLEGGTHNAHAPPFDFIVRAFAPLINRLGPYISTTIARPGFYPRGGGQFSVQIEPSSTLRGFKLNERGATQSQRATAMVAHLPRHVAERELATLGRKLGWTDDELRTEEITTSSGPGNVLLAEVVSEHVTELFIEFGERGVRAEMVAERLARQVRAYLKADVPIGEYLADQLLLPLALAGYGEFTTGPLSLHATTQIDLIRQFLPVTIAVTETGKNVRVSISSEK